MHRVGLYIMSRLCSNMSSIRLIVIIRYPETDEKWLERKETQLTYFTPTCYGFLISSKTLCFVLIVLEGFVWSHRRITGLMSQRQFAPKC